MKKYKCFHLLLFCCFIWFVSCKHAKVLDAFDYIRFVENEKNGLLIKKEVGNYLFRLQYKPVPYMVLTDNEHLPINQEQFLAEEREYSKFQYFTLRITMNNDPENSVFMYDVGSEEQYNNLLHYFETDMKNDIRLIVGDHSYPATTIHYVRENDRGEFNNFLVAFPAIVHSEVNRTFVFNDRLLKNGVIQFTVESQALSNIPELKL